MATVANAENYARINTLADRQTDLTVKTLGEEKVKK